MPDIQCEQCGETIKADALSCWACGTLTPAGHRAREAGPDDDEAWQQSVAAARRRQAEQPAVDPEAVLQRVLVDTGQDRPVARRRPEPVRDLRRDSRQLLSAAETLGSLGALLAFFTSLGGCWRRWSGFSPATRFSCWPASRPSSPWAAWPSMRTSSASSWWRWGGPWLKIGRAACRERV